jgi:hypothetical protein
VRRIAARIYQRSQRAAHRHWGAPSTKRRWVVDFIEECASFPGGAHDDQVDAWSQGANYMGRRVVQPNIRFFDEGPVQPSPHSLSGSFGDWLRTG